MEKVKKRDLLSLWNILERLKIVKEKRISYFIAKNRLEIKNEIEALQEAQMPSELFKLYDEKRAALAERMADRVEGTTTPMTKDGQYIITHNRDDFDEELTELKDKFKKAIDERKTQIEIFNELLEEETEFKGYSITLENLPDNIEAYVIEVLLKIGLIDE